LAKLVRFNDVPVVAKLFGAVTYRQFFVSDGGGPIGNEVYTRGEKRYEQGYSICRFAEAKPSKKKKGEVQPLHYHPQRNPFLIVGLKGKRTMLVGGKKFDILPGTMLQIERGETHRTLNYGKARYLTIEIWNSDPKDDEIFVTDEGEKSVVEMFSGQKGETLTESQRQTMDEKGKV
jgi:mannose-6-phosphate isomerase-like protein (cupin superfamily)